MRGGVAVGGQAALLSDGVGPLGFRAALGPALERILTMRERKTGIGMREGRIEAERHLEKVARLVVIGLVKPVHVPEGARVSISLAIEATILSPISFRIRMHHPGFGQCTPSRRSVQSGSPPARLRPAAACRRAALTRSRCNRP